MRPMLLLLCAGLALAAAGCGSDGGTSGTTAAPAAAETTPAASENVVTVDMRNIRFEPREVTVDVGQVVRWVNQDNVEHDAVAESGADFASDQFGIGGRFEWKADKAGTVEYVCTLHPGMTGTIVVR